MSDEHIKVEEIVVEEIVIDDMVAAYKHNPEEIGRYLMHLIADLLQAGMRGEELLAILNEATVLAFGTGEEQRH